MKMSKIAGVMMTSVSLILLSWPALAELPSELKPKFEQFSADARVLGLAEIDHQACAPIDSSPTALSADFDGDGRPDFAVLLNLGKTGKKVEWQGSLLEEIEVALVLFHTNFRKDGYSTRTIQRTRSYLPVAMTIKAVPSGVLTGRDSKPIARLEKAGFALSICEKSATAYFFDRDRKFRSAPLVD